ncbi:MAG: IS3 family transposase [Armatimonadota bacterium]
MKEAIQTTIGTWPRYGSKRVAAQMKRDGISFHDKTVGERRTRRLVREMGLLARA